MFLVKLLKSISPKRLTPALLASMTVALIIGATIVSASAATFTGTLTSTDPTFNRWTAFAQGGTCALSGVGSAVRYKTFQFTLTGSGNVVVSLLTADGAVLAPANPDTFIGLYPAGSFNPAAACTGAISANDDSGGTAQSKITTTTALPAGNYTIVVTSFDNVPGPPNGDALPWAFTGVVTGPTVLNAKAPMDFNGDGRTDYSLVRDSGIVGIADQQMAEGEGIRRDKGKWIAERAELIAQNSPQANKVNWLTLLNGGSFTGLQWGLNTDFFIGGDFDGDNRNDYAVWRPGTQGVFYILRSSNSTVQIENFGQTGDDPSVVADYDGDGRTDVAVYRLSATGNTFFYRGSLNNPSGSTTFLPWGTNGNAAFTDYPYPGDFDGDGRADVGIFRDNTSGADTFIVRNSTGGAVTWLNWGSASSFAAPGDYNGDGKTDFCSTVNVVGGKRLYYVFLNGVGGQPAVEFGLSTNLIAQGDYDGDGRTDIASYNQSNGTFYVRPSSNVATTTVVQWGQAADYPMANFNTH